MSTATIREAATERASSSRVGARRHLRRQIRSPLKTVLMRIGAGAIRRPIFGRYWLRFGYTLNLDDPGEISLGKRTIATHFVDHDSGSNDTASLGGSLKSISNRLSASEPDISQIQ